MINVKGHIHSSNCFNWLILPLSTYYDEPSLGFQYYWAQSLNCVSQILNKIGHPRNRKYWICAILVHVILSNHLKNLLQKTDEDTLWLDEDYCGL